MYIFKGFSEKMYRYIVINSLKREKIFRFKKELDAKQFVINSNRNIKY